MIDYKYRKLFDEVKHVRERAYAPYSNFKVGAGILLKNGKILTGINIENSSYGLTMCAERNAMFRLYMEQYKASDVVCLLVLADTEKPVSPCGACRQVMEELLTLDTTVVLCNLKEDMIETTVEELLPYSFDKKDL